MRLETEARLSKDTGAWDYCALQRYLSVLRGRGKPPGPKLSYLLVESSSSESKKLVVSSSLLMSVEELSYPPRSRRRSPFTVPFTLGAMKRQDSTCLRQATRKQPLPLRKAHSNLLSMNLASRQSH